ncbi:MAG: nucleotidyltransferase family protein [Prochlorotrichaceae cyanobacterium]
MRYTEVRLYLKKKHDSRRAKRLALWEAARQDAKNIIEMIIQEYHPKQVIQWGSILDARHFSEASDIDVAVVGLDSLSFMRLLADAEDLTEFPLDLIQFELIHPSFQKIILMKGKVIYG